MSEQNTSIAGPTTVAEVAEPVAAATGDHIVVGIICAMKSEAKPFLEAMTDRRQIASRPGRVFVGSINGKLVVLSICGVGTAKAAAATEDLLGLYQLPCLIMSGTAGGVDESLQINDTVVATESVFHDVSAAELFERHPSLDSAVFASDSLLLAKTEAALKSQHYEQNVVFGRVASGDAFMNKKNVGSIIANANPLSVDMETAAVALVCQLHSLPFIAFRSITDTQAKPGMLTFALNLRTAARRSFMVAELLLNELI